MPNIIGTGSFAYPSASETANVLTVYGQQLAVTAANLNNPMEILAAVSGCSVQFPNVSGAAYAPGQAHFTGFVHPASYPLPVYNGGVAGTEPVLEKVLPPGAQYRFGLLSHTSGTVFGGNYSAAAGLWNFQHTDATGALKRVVPCSSGMGPSVSLGASGNAINDPVPSNQGNQSSVMLGSTLGIAVFQMANFDIKTIAFQCSADGKTQAASTLTTVKANGGANLSFPFVEKLDATHAIISWWDATNLKNNWVVVAIVAGVLPTGPTVTVGTVSDDTSLAAGLRIIDPNSSGTMFTRDLGTTNVWLIGASGATNSTRARAYYLTCDVVGLTVTLSASSDYDSTHANSANRGFYGCSIAAGKIFTWNNSTAKSLSVLSYSASSISVSGSAIPFDLGTAPLRMAVDPINVSANQFVIWNNVDGFPNGYICQINFVTTAIDFHIAFGLNDQVSPNVINTGNVGSPSAISMTLLTSRLGPGEFIISQLNYTDYYDVLSYAEAGIQNGGGTATSAVTNPAEVLGQSQPITVPGGFPISSTHLRAFFCFDATTRRGVAWTWQNESAGIQFAHFTFFDFPRK